jgi:5'-nucleotidase / UDP-sugar diphosphatase
VTYPDDLPGKAPSRARSLRQIAVTSDVHSSLSGAVAMASHLHGLRENTLLADCGDFFEGAGYYSLGGGTAETMLLTSLYDIVAPGNHGYRHHIRDLDLNNITACANITYQSGERVFGALRVFDFGSSSVAVTAVMGVEAFTSIPPAERAGHQVLDPAQALRALREQHPSAADFWVVLSHAGFAHDLALARVCPFVNVIFSGHCHSETYGPVAIGEVTVVKGAELAVGYAIAWPDHGRWRATTSTFPPQYGSAEPPADLAPALRRVREMSETLAEPIGPLDQVFASRAPTRPELLSELGKAVIQMTGADMAMFNESCLRSTHLGPIIRSGDLMTLEPFGNSLTCVRTSDPSAVARNLAERCGQIVCVPDSAAITEPPTIVATTSYLLETYLSACQEVPFPDPQCTRPLLIRDVLRDVLLAKTSRDSEIHRRTP